jgi:multimeric flavodoxin WrbA
LKRGDAPSSTEKLIGELLDALKTHGVTGTSIRAADYNLLPGVTSDEGKDDDWPALRAQLLSAYILIIGTPIWLGRPSSIAKRVLERMDAFLQETDDKGRMPSFGKVAIVAVVGNEDGAHHCHAEIFQALNDVGSLSPQGWRLLGKRSDGIGRLQASDQALQQDSRDNRDARIQCNTSSWSFEVHHISRYRSKITAASMCDTHVERDREPLSMKA